MSFISFEFVALLLLSFIAFHATPARHRKYVMLTASCAFIGYYNLSFLLTALAVSLLTYAAARLMERAQQRGGQARTAYWTGIAALLLLWTGFRHSWWMGQTSILFPLGISFYTFQAVAYLTEIYWKEEKAEHSLPAFLLYMLLFMKFLSGPIERPADLLPQIREMRPVPYKMMTYGLLTIVVGLVKKLMLADHLAPGIDSVFDSVRTASGVQLLMAGLLYPVELYADFSGYTDIAIGCAMLFGIRLSPNFDRPFTAQTTADFWRRWHMSLSFWVRDYLYMPLASLTRRWGTSGLTLSLLVTFILLGVWHGTGWTFAVYGLIQGVIIVWENKTQRLREAAHQRMGDRLFSICSIVRTYLIFAFSLVFFRTKTMDDALYFLSHISFRTHLTWKELNLGLSDHALIVVGSTLLLMLAYEHFAARKDLLRALQEKPVWLRWAIYYAIVIVLFAYGKIGTENFIYLQFYHDGREPHTQTKTCYTEGHLQTPVLQPPLLGRHPALFP